MFFALNKLSQNLREAAQSAAAAAMGVVSASPLKIAEVIDSDEVALVKAYLKAGETEKKIKNDGYSQATIDAAIKEASKEGYELIWDEASRFVQDKMEVEFTQQIATQLKLQRDREEQNNAVQRIGEDPGQQIIVGPLLGEPEEHNHVVQRVGEDPAQEKIAGPLFPGKKTPALKEQKESDESKKIFAFVEDAKEYYCTLRLIFGDAILSCNRLLKSVTFELDNNNMRRETRILLSELDAHRSFRGLFVRVCNDVVDSQEAGKIQDVLGRTSHFFNKDSGTVDHIIQTMVQILTRNHASQCVASFNTGTATDLQPGLMEIISVEGCEMGDNFITMHPDAVNHFTVLFKAIMSGSEGAPTDLESLGDSGKLLDVIKTLSSQRNALEGPDKSAVQSGQNTPEKPKMR